jgi:MFS family permease
VYFFVYFHRVSTSVIVADLLSAFSTNAAALGLMSSMYFYIYAAEQPLVGYLADRLGPRRVIGYWSLLAAIGCFLFGLAPNIWWASVGRTLIGFGVGGVYVPAIKAFSLWFEKKEFTTMIGLLMAVGNFGAVIATTPLAWAAGFWGWRLTFFLIGAITVALAFATLMLTRDHQALPKANRSKTCEAHDAFSDSRPQAIDVLASGQFWMMAIIFFGIYGTFITLQGLWATPYLMAIFKIQPLFASKLNMLIPVGVILGAPILGWITDRFSFGKKVVLLAILCMYLLTWIGITFFYWALGINGFAVLLFVMGFVAGGFISILWGIVRDTMASEILGLASGLLNPAPFFGVAVFQLLTGTILEQYKGIGGVYSLQGFRNAFMVCLIANAVCLVLSFFLGKPKQNQI